jgi:hypothetical protein
MKKLIVNQRLENEKFMTIIQNVSKLNVLFDYQGRQMGAGGAVGAYYCCRCVYFSMFLYILAIFDMFFTI